MFRLHLKYIYVCCKKYKLTIKYYIALATFSPKCQHLIRRFREIFLGRRMKFTLRLRRRETLLPRNGLPERAVSRKNTREMFSKINYAHSEIGRVARARR